MLSLRSSSNTSDRVPEAAGVLAIQTGRAARNSRSNKRRARRPPRITIRFTGIRERTLRQIPKPKTAAKGRPSHHAAGASKRIAAIMGNQLLRNEAGSRWPETNMAAPLPDAHLERFQFPANVSGSFFRQLLKVFLNAAAIRRRQA